MSENGSVKNLTPTTLILIVLAASGLGLGGTSQYTAQSLQLQVEALQTQNILERDERKEGDDKLDERLQREFTLITDTTIEKLESLKTQLDLQLVNNRDRINDTNNLVDAVIQSLREDRDRINQIVTENAELRTEIENLKGQ